MNISINFNVVKSLILTIFALWGTFGLAQIPQAPKVQTPTPISPNQSYTSDNSNLSKTPKPTALTEQNRQKQQTIYNNNRNASSHMGYNPAPTQQEINNNRYQDPLKAQKQQSEIDKIIRELEMSKTRERQINFNMPSYSSRYPTQTKYYYDAYDELDKMLKGDIPVDVGRAVFISENAYNDNTMDYQEFDAVIDEIVNFCYQFMEQEGYSKTDNLAKNMVIYRLMSDTLQIKNTGQTHLPVGYDFEDYMGYKDWRKMFVTKLLNTNSGQCHSMPLLYKIIADRMGAEAFLAFSPKHSYIKFRDEYNRWYNIELTNGMLITEDLIMESGYIKTEAIQSGIYMDTLSQRQTIAYMMQDLAKGYGIKFGSDKFVIETVNRSLKEYPNSIHGLMLKSDYYTGLFDQYMRTIGKPYPSLQQLKIKYPIVYDTYMQRNAVYDMVDNTGYEPMPDEMYEAWLKSVEREKIRLEEEKNKPPQIRVIEQEKK